MNLEMYYLTRRQRCQFPTWSKKSIIIRSKFFFLFIGREPTTWPANNCLQIMVCSCAMPSNSVWLYRRKMSTHSLQKMTRDRFRVMSLAPRRKCPRNVVQMNEAMAAFFGNDSVAISCHCKRSKVILVKVLTEVCSLENIASWKRRKIALALSDSVLLTLRSLVSMWKTCRKGG